MYTIYTIAHPLTNEIVYVGCTKDLSTRIRSHVNCKTTLHVQGYIQTLRESFLYPKIEPLDSVKEGDDPFEAKTFWIAQLKSWGFNLLNKNKTSPIKKVYYEKKKFKVVKGVKVERKSRKWKEGMFFVGNIFELGNTTQEVFTATFKNYCRKFGVVLYLKYSEDKSTATIVDKKPYKEKYVPNFIWPKGKDRKQNSNANHDFDPLKEVGGVVVIRLKTSLQSFKTKCGYHLRKIPEKTRMKYELLDNGFVRATRIK